jgi:hypothetical protein
MDDRHRLLQHLYGERPLSERLARRLDTDPDLRREYEGMRDTKAALDRRPAAGPDPDAVDRVLQASRSRPDPRPDDRPPRRPDRRALRRRLPVAAGLAVLLAAAWIWSLGPAGPAPAPPPAESVAVSYPSAGLTAPSQPAVASGPAVPTWDRGAEVVRLHRRLNLVRARSAPAEWAPALPVAPSAPSAPASSEPAAPSR